MNRARLIGVLAAVTIVAGCGNKPVHTGGGADNAPPPCATLFASGRTTAKDMIDAPCNRGRGIGETYVAGTTVTDCTDGTHLIWNDEGWGIIGKPWHRHASGAEKVAPNSAQDRCEA